MARPGIQRDGVTEIYCPTDPLVDVVLVHGLNGHPYDTWATSTEPQIFWPRDLLPDQLAKQRCRVLVYGYNADVTSTTGCISQDFIHSIADSFGEKLAANRGQHRERPIIFVCHSLGGLVVKRMLNFAAAIQDENLHNQRSIFVSTHAVIFLGTPHDGSDLAATGIMLQSLCAAVIPRKFLDTSSHLVAALVTHSQQLQVISRDFSNIMSRFKLYCFWEMLPTDLKATRSIVVTEASAYPNWVGVPHSGIDKDHISMCKFESSTASGFDVLCFNLRQFAEQAVGEIATAWMYEKRDVRRRKEDQYQLFQNSSNTSIHELRDRHTRTNTTLSFDRFSVDDTLVEGGSPQYSETPLMIAPHNFRRNKDCLGFKEQLEMMDLQLKDKSQSEIGTSTVLLCGPTGCGKTHLACQYVWDHRHENYGGTFWIDCKSPESLRSGYLDIAIGLRLIDEQARNNLRSVSFEELSTSIREKLRKRSNWIMVFDGIMLATKREIKQFGELLPNARGSKIIIVSLNKGLAGHKDLYEPTAIRVPPLSTSDAMQLLYMKMKITSPTEAERRKARSLVKCYKCLPLAIHAAAHLLEARGCKLTQFEPADVRKSDEVDERVLEVISILSTRTKPEAMALLTLLSLIFHRVPKAMLQFGAKFLAINGHRIESRRDDISLRCDLDNTISTLEQYGLIEVETSLSTSCQSSPDSSRKSTQEMEEKQSIHSSLTKNLANISTEGVPRLPVDTSLESSTPAIEFIEIQNIAQKVIYSQLKADGENYRRWVAFASRFLQASYASAETSSLARSDRLSAGDFEHYRLHADTVERLMSKSIENPIWFGDEKQKLIGFLDALESTRTFQTASRAEHIFDRPYIPVSVFAKKHSSPFDGSYSNVQSQPAYARSVITDAERQSQSPQNVGYQGINIPPISPQMSNDGFLIERRDSRKGANNRRKSSFLKNLFHKRPDDSPVIDTSPYSRDVSPSSPKAWPLSSFRRRSSASVTARPMLTIGDAPLFDGQRPPADDSSIQVLHIPKPLAIRRRILSDKSTNIFDQHLAPDYAEPMRKTQSSPAYGLGINKSQSPAETGAQYLAGWPSGLPFEKDITTFRRRPESVRTAVNHNFSPNTTSYETQSTHASTAMAREMSHESAISSLSVPDMISSNLASPRPEYSEPSTPQTEPSHVSWKERQSRPNSGTGDFQNWRYTKSESKSPKYH